MDETSTTQKGNPYILPGAIIIAGLIIAGAVLFSNSNSETTGTIVSTDNEVQEEVAPVTDSDHVRGPRDADVFLIEYSDYRCGYCGIFHDTVVQLINDDEYKGKIAWVYRHTPYQSGGKEAAVASECIAEQLGEDAFWEYSDRAFENQRQLTDKWHTDTAVELGADKEAFNECVSSGKYDALIAAHTTEAQSIGAKGTPYNVLLTREGNIVKFSGAQPYENVKIFVNRALNSLK